MRVVVFFDLPTTEPEDKKEYTKFRNSLTKEGFSMVQYSVYSRICTNKDSADKYINKLHKISPNRGSVRALILTEKQYSNMFIICGGFTSSEESIKDRRLIYFWLILKAIIIT